jgi:hypothetical protein
MKIIVNLRAVSRVLLIKICLAKIKVAREMFIIEVEQGNETYIPNELSQDKLPMSFWFYDPILIWVQDQVSKSKQHLCNFRNEFRLNFFRENSLKRRVMSSLGAGSGDTAQPEKQVYKHHAVAEDELKEIIPGKSCHVMCLQRSPYLVIDENLANLKKHERILSINRQDERLRSQAFPDDLPRFFRQSRRFRAETRQLVLRYCRPEEINVLRQRAILVKSSFLSKLEFMQGLGLKDQLMAQLEGAIDEKIEEI